MWSHFFCLFFFWSYGSVFLTCVGPLQNKQWCSEPRAASVHTAFLRHCMKIDGFDIISKASLSHTPAVEDRMRSTPPCPRHCSDTPSLVLFFFLPLHSSPRFASTLVNDGRLGARTALNSTRSVRAPNSIYDYKKQVIRAGCERGERKWRKAREPAAESGCARERARNGINYLLTTEM